MAAAVEEPVLTNLAEMIDLSIGSPENGVVDFNMLHMVLHCLAQQIRISDKNVELRGEAASLPVGRVADNAPTIVITEFLVDTEAPGKYELATSSVTSDQESVLVVERKRRDMIPPPTPKVKEAKERKPAPAPPQPEPPPPQTTPPQPAPEVVPPSFERPPPRSTSTMSITKEKLSLVTLSKFNVLETAVQDLMDRVYGTSPKNEAILQEVRSQSNLKAITEMWTNMNVASRLEAAEEGIAKLSSLIQDLIGETAALQNQIDTMPTQTQSAPAPAQIVIPPAVTPSPSTVNLDHLATKDELGQVLDYCATKDQLGQVLDYCATKDQLGQVLGYLESIRDELDNLAKNVNEALMEVNPEFEPPPPPLRSELVLAPSVMAPPVVALSRTQQSTAPIVQQSQSAQQPQLEPPAVQPQVAPSDLLGQQLTHLQQRLAQMEIELRKCCDGNKKTEGVIKNQFTSFQDQLEYMSKQIAEFTSEFGAGKLSPDLVQDLQGLMNLFEIVQSMKVQLEQVHETALNLAAEKEARQNNIDAVLEQIELLKMIKLDREDMVEALADKADLRMLARKVSHDQFENACDDLSKGLEHAFGKLNVQESLWQQALDDIQREIEQKLDKIELSPVKVFFNNKLKQLQENLRQMAAFRREAEAAGTKRRLLRDVNCISCDANAVMQMDALPPQPPKPLPAHLSMKPYLSYELDAIRKNQANALPQRNMHDWEHVQQQMQPSKQYKVRSDTGKHLCNRYCGGSHTTTTPAQRVARLGHFIKQWGPEVLPLSSGFAAGDDGRLYKISTSEGANVGPGGAVEGAAVCTPKSPVKKQDKDKSQTPKTMEIAAECLCLDPTAGRTLPNEKPK